MPTDAHDAVLGDFGSIDMMATRCCSYNAPYYICRDRPTFHPAAVLRKLSTPTHCLNRLACARSNDHPQATRGWRSPALHTTTPLHGYSRLPAVPSVTLHSTSRGAARFAWRHRHAVHLLNGLLTFQVTYGPRSAVTQGPGNHSFCARWVTGTGCALVPCPKALRKKETLCLQHRRCMLQWQVG